MIYRCFLGRLETIPSCTSFLRNTVPVFHIGNTGNNACKCSNVVSNRDNDQGQRYDTLLYAKLLVSEYPRTTAKALSRGAWFSILYTRTRSSLSAGLCPEPLGNSRRNPYLDLREELPGQERDATGKKGNGWSKTKGRMRKEGTKGEGLIKESENISYRHLSHFQPCIECITFLCSNWVLLTCWWENVIVIRRR